jgi:hypothetical protein
MSQMTVKHRSDDPPGSELVRVVDFFCRIHVVFLKTRRGVLTANFNSAAEGEGS